MEHATILSPVYAMMRADRLPPGHFGKGSPGATEPDTGQGLSLAEVYAWGPGIRMPPGGKGFSSEKENRAPGTFLPVRESNG